jgi:hypothetical protein
MGIVLSGRARSVCGTSIDRLQVSSITRVNETFKDQPYTTHMTFDFGYLSESYSCDSAVKRSDSVNAPMHHANAISLNRRFDDLVV